MARSVASSALRVLLVDRDYRRREALRQSIVQFGHMVVAEADDGEKAVVIARRLRPDVVVTSAQLPHLSGVEVAHELNRDGIAPTAILSPSRQAGLVRKAILAGAMALYVTPVSADSLAANLPVAVQAWRSERNSVEHLIVLEQRLATRDTIGAAKSVLMRRYGISEREAYQRIRQCSMDSRQPMRRVAMAVIEADEVADAVSMMVSPGS